MRAMLIWSDGHSLNYTIELADKFANIIGISRNAEDYEN